MQVASTELPLSFAQKHDLGDRYLTWLGWVLLGYALLGRGFAYWGIAPFYIGEITALIGLLALFSTSHVSQVLREPLFKLMIGLMAWGLFCTIPYVSVYGIDALRDAVLWGYGCFAIITAGLLMQNPERLRLLLLRYRRFIVIFGVLAWLVLVLKNYAGILPRVPGSTIPLVQAKSGDTLVHVAGAGAFVIAGMARIHPVVLGLLMLAFMQGNRAGMLACSVALGIAVLLTPFKAKVARFAYFVGCILVVLAISMPTITIGRKTVSVEELWTKAESIFVESSVRNYNNTVDWRLDWWTTIIDYTVYGPYFWTGKGYGVNLSVDDGFQSGAGEALRSPHNSHMTVLARSGVPGFLLWVLLHLGWLWCMLHHYMRSRRASDFAWTGVFAFLIAYWTGIMVNAGFDVVLESPMGGIWMWTLFGVGVAAMHIHTYHPHVITQ